jgi:general secretion pathway protein D
MNTIRKFGLIAFSLMVFGCAQNQGFIDARKEFESGDVEAGLAKIEAAHKADPKDVEIKNYLERQRAVVVQRYLANGDNARAAGALEQAESAYKSAQRFDPDNARAKAGLDMVAKDRRSVAVLREAENALRVGDTELAYQKAQEVLAEHPTQREARAIVRRVDEKKLKEESATPKLNAALKKPITMEFRDAPVRTVFELVSKHTGLNFVFDKEVPADAKATVFVRNTTIEDVIRFVLVTNQLERKVLNDNTVLIYPNTPAKARDYKDLVVRSFYLANADVKQTATMVRQLVKTRDLFVDEKLNLLVIRDTPEAIRVAEKLIANQDLGEPEVMLEVEILEVGYNQLQQLGIQWPGSLGVSLVGAAGVAGQITGREATRGLNGGLVRLTVPDPLVQFNAKRQDGRTNVLANPRIRVKNKEKAKIHIGDKVPVITTTAGATGFVSESVNYLDVGLKLEVEPLIYLEDDVGIKIGLEVSNIARQITSPTGTVSYQVGTRTAATSLRLRDGETQVLAGLINNEDRRNANRVPGLSDLPTIGRIFSNNDDTVNKTEIVLLITPRVIRNVNRPEVRLEEFNSGTEAEVGGASLGLPPVAGPAPIPTAPPPPAAAPSQVPSAPAAPFPPLAPVIPANPPAAGPKPQPQ